MSLTEKNREIVQQFSRRIAERGYEGKLEFDPIPNTCKRRRPYYHKGDTCVFTGFLWQMNKMDDTQLAEDIDQRISDAVRHFNL